MVSQYSLLLYVAEFSTVFAYIENSIIVLSPVAWWVILAPTRIDFVGLRLTA